MLAFKVLSLIPYRTYMWITRKTIRFYRNNFSSDDGHLGVIVRLSVRLTYYFGRAIHKHPLWKYSVICLKTTQWSIRWKKKHCTHTRYTLQVTLTSECTKQEIKSIKVVIIVTIDNIRIHYNFRILHNALSSKTKCFHYYSMFLHRKIMKNNICDANSHPKIMIISEIDPYAQCPNVHGSRFTVSIRHLVNWICGEWSWIYGKIVHIFISINLERQNDSIWQVPKQTHFRFPV